MKLKIPPPLYMLAFLLFMWLLAKYLPIMHWDYPVFSVLAIFFLLLGFIIDASSVMQFFANKTTVSPLKPQNSKKLVVSGMYSFTRNPMYLGLLFILFAYACYLSCLTPFLLLPIFIWVITVVQIKPEEEMLEELFKDTYRDYKKKVRRWI